MTGPIGRVTLLLASADLSKRDLQTFARWVETVGAREVVDIIEEIRALADADALAISSDNQAAWNRSPSVGKHSDLSAKVEHLLVEEARLTRREAAELLRSELERQTDTQSRVPELQRKSFREWIDRITEVVPESVLLHVVTRIRNNLVHSVSPDWPLKRSVK